MKSLVIAPHPDDEVLGVGGTLLRRKAEGASTAWVIITEMSKETGFTDEEVKYRGMEIEKISKLFNFNKVFKLGFPTTQLETIAIRDLISSISDCLISFKPDEIFIPHPLDVHSDHRIVFEAAMSCTKWFRHPFLKRVLAYETLSETEANLNIENGFKPNVYVDISDYLEDKLKAMNIYESEIGTFPFPRSEEAISALARFRGASSGYLASEAFELLRERY